MRMIAVTINSSIRWRIGQNDPVLLGAISDRYRLVNPVVYAEMQPMLDLGKPTSRNNSLFLPSDDAIILSTDDVWVAVSESTEGPALDEDGGSIPDDVYDDLFVVVPAFLRWVRFLGFQHQMPSVSYVIAYEVVDNGIEAVPDFPDPRNSRICRCRDYLVSKCVSADIATAAAAKAVAGDTTPVYHEFLVDSYAAFRSNDYRQALLYAAIAAESLAATKLDHIYKQRLDGGCGPSLRIVELQQAGGLTVRKDPVYEALSLKTEFSSLLHDRPLYLIGKSLQVERPETYRLARMLYATRNRIVHRGELSEKDANQCFSLTEIDAWKALQCVADLFYWFGEPVNYPGFGIVESRVVNWGARSAF